MAFHIHKVAAIAKIKISDDKAEDFTADMAEIMKMVENLPVLTESETVFREESAVLRPDEVVASYPQEAILQNSANTQAGCFLVPITVGTEKV